MGEVMFFRDWCYCDLLLAHRVRRKKRLDRILFCKYNVFGLQIDDLYFFLFVVVKGGVHSCTDWRDSGEQRREKG